MLGCKMKAVRAACEGILKSFCEKKGTLHRKYSTHDSRLLDHSYVYSLGIKNLKYSTFVHRQPHYLNKFPVRWYSAQPATGLPQLTKLPQEVFPGVLAPFSNFFLTYLVIRPFVDGSFELREFVAASKQVVQIVSRKLASDDVDGLEDMMTSATLQEVKQNLPRFTESQRQELAIDQEDIYITASTDMIFQNDREHDKKTLEISMVYHVMRGFKHMKFQGFNPFQNMQNPQQQSDSAENPFEKLKVDEDKAYILNYKFIREYSGGVASDWLLNGLNHYKKSQIAVQGFPSF
ncbi:uncharacterized protein LOC135832767 [Planococcus citri]|uniref:uncharacterized protein LOC135832767 n=1 Tax=Planococcus citri TaxID=170843 RepID=UPI0031F72BFB